MSEQGKPTAGQKKVDKHPGMLGDGTEEQNLDQTGDPGARISEAEVDEAFGQKSDGKKDRPKK